MAHVDWLEKALLNIRPYSKEYYAVKRVVESWGHWKRRTSPGAFKKGYDPRRKTQSEVHER